MRHGPKFRPPGDLLGVLPVGAVRHRSGRLARNARHYLCTPGGVRKISWGDLDAQDLTRARAALDDRQVLLVCPERPPGADASDAWCWYDEEDPPELTVETIADAAILVVTTTEILRPGHSTVTNTRVTERGGTAAMLLRGAEVHDWLSRYVGWS